jgi:hypothetical protein
MLQRPNARAGWQPTQAVGSQFFSGLLGVAGTGRRDFSSQTKNLSSYHIEVNNAERKDATKLTVTGPDVPGLLASMTVALAVKGCSLKELHAADEKGANSFKDPSEPHRKHVEEAPHQIKDIFFVVNRETGSQFEDDSLEDLARSLLESTKSPMNVLCVSGAMRKLERMDENMQHPAKMADKGHITIIPSKK